MTKILSIFSTLLIIVILIQPFQKLWIVLSFEMNKEYIAQNLCENKEQEDKELEEAKRVNEFAEKYGLRCAGSCQLKKQLAEAEQKQDDVPVSSVKYTLDLLFLEKNLSFSFDNQINSVEKPLQNGFYQGFVSTSNLYGVFRPPVYL
ncbi:hypothetical protein WAF17_13625 [Bernardetia sp. ABR2-2B]|uniref:hypothetical protein n=1 Tax=Bernardetia sp. ABR2-2B TaxID=3127472 RepID=UPI0030D28859